jgi:signal transduction histidine kinase
MKAMRAIINNLRPTVLDLGLNAAMEWQVKEFQRRTGISCNLSMQEEELVIDDTRATALFRILQESLNNVLRHAQATSADIELFQDGVNLYMKVADNGIGIFPNCRRKANSFGLVGIKERISALGGELVIDTARNRGTSVTVSIPMDKDISMVQIDGREMPDMVASLTRLKENVDLLRISTKPVSGERKRKESRSVKSGTAKA